MRRRESDIGMLGGLLGIIIGALSFVISGILSIVHLRVESGVVTSVVAMLLGLIGIFGAGVTRRDRLVGGIVMLVVSVLGFSLVNGFYLISSVILLIAGVIALVEHFR